MLDSDIAKLYQVETKRINEAVKNNPEKFELYNNGLSILGEIRLTATSIIIENPTIINGQQTLYNLMYAKEKGIDISKIVIPVFIKTLSDSKERLNVARFNNFQKQVKDIDLLSIHSGLREIQEQLLTNTNILHPFISIRLVKK